MKKWGKKSKSRYEAIKEMIEFIEKNEITEFKDLFDYACEFEEDWFKHLCDSCAYVINQYIKSFRHKPKNKES